MTTHAPAFVTAAVTGTSALVRDRLGGLRWFDVPGGAELAALEPGSADLAALSADGRSLALIERGGDIRVIEGAAVPARLLAPYVRALAVARGGRDVVVASAGSPGRLEVFHDGASAAAASLGDVSRVRLHADESLGCIAVETAAGADEPVLRTVFRFDGDTLETMWEGTAVGAVAGPALASALYLRGPEGIVRRVPGQPDRVAPGTPADLLAAGSDARFLLAARPLRYVDDGARALLRVLDAVTLAVISAREDDVDEWSSTALVLTSELDVIALRPADDGGLNIAHVGARSAPSPRGD